MHSEEARAALQGLVGCAGSAAGGSGDCASGAMGAAAAVVLNDLLKTGKTTATDKDGKPLTLAEQQARDNLVATIVAAVASGAGLDAQSAATSAHLETQNNSTTTPLGLYSPDGKHGLPVAEVYEKDPAFREAVNKLGGLSAFDKVSACANAKEPCTLSADQQAALDAYSLGSQNVVGQQQIDARLCNGNTPLLCAVQGVNAFNQTPTGVRLVGGMQLVGGGLEAAGGVVTIAAGAASCPESLGLGCGGVVLGVAATGMGLDQAQSGLRALWAGTPVGTGGGYALSAVSGMSRADAEAWYGQANMVVGFATAGFANAAELSTLANVRNGYVYTVAADTAAPAGRTFVTNDPGVGPLIDAIEARAPGTVKQAEIKIYRPDGTTYTDFDIVTDTHVIQVKVGGGKGFVGQIVTSQGLTDYPVIGFDANGLAGTGQSFKITVLRNAQQKGIEIHGDVDALIKAIGK